MPELSIACDPAIVERYEIGELLGAGGFAKVYRGRQRTTGQAVAVKVLELDRGPYAAETAVQIERFRREARFAALQHPNIVPVIETGETASGQPYLVLAFIPGRDLNEVLAAGGSLEPIEALRLMTQVLDALSCAHAHGIVHRDLKPENIRISAAGACSNAILFDFGISALVPERAVDEERRLTDRGEYVGTPAYSAPEQLRGEPPTVLSDIYAWGLIFIECLTGRPAVNAKGPHEAIHVQLSPSAIRVPEALRGHELGELLGLATQKRVDRRQLHTATLMTALQRIDPRALPPRTAFGAQGYASELDSDANADPRFVSGTWQTSQLWRVPLARNPNFTGRLQLLDRISESFAQANRFATVALHGMGGVGKSQLALEYAYSRSDHYRVVAWLRAEETETLAADYISLGPVLGLPDTPDQRQRIEDVQNWLERNGRWLLIFDNAPNPGAIRNFLPRLHAGHVLLTSRHPGWKDLASSLAVEVLERRESIAFLMRRSGSADETTASDLGEELGRLPLALEEASAYMETTGRSMRSYLTMLRSQKRRLLFAEDTSGEHRNTLRTTWELSFRQIESETPAASDLLKLCSFLAPDDIPLALLKRGARVLPDSLRAIAQDDVALDACVGALRRFSLVKAEAEAMSIHRLVQLATRERLTPEAHEHWSIEALALIEAAYPRHPTVGEYRPEPGRFLPHALIVLHREHTDSRAVGLSARLWRRVGVYLSTRGSHLEAWDFLEHALSQLEAEGTDTLQIGGAMWDLGMVLYALGEANVSRDLLTRGLEVLRTAPQATFLRAQLHLALAWVARTLGDYPATCESAELAHAALTATVKAGHHLTAMACALRGRGFWGLGNVPGARDSLREALEVLRTTPEPRHALNCGIWYCVAQLQYEFGEFQEALASATRAVDIGQQAYGRDHPFVSTSLTVRGASLLRLGDADAARECCERALESGQRACRHLHEDIAVARGHLAGALRIARQSAMAAEHLTHALEELPRLCGDTTRVAMVAHLTWAQLMRDQGQRERAREHCEAALHVFQRTYSRAHPGCLPALRLLGSLEREEGDSARAAETFREVVRRAHEADLTAHPDALACAQQLFELGRRNEEGPPPRDSIVRVKQFIERTVEHAQAAARRIPWRRKR